MLSLSLLSVVTVALPSSYSSLSLFVPPVVQVADVHIGVILPVVPTVVLLIVVK